MQQLEWRHTGGQTALETGKIVTAMPSRFVVMAGDAAMLARQAVGCLVEPRVGDTVLLAVTGAEEAFILSVLTRDGERSAPVDLVFDGPVSLQVRDGGFSVQTDGDLRLASRRKLACLSDVLSVQARQGRARLARFSFVGQFLKSRVRRLKTVALQADATFRRLTQRLENSFRFVADRDELQCRTSRVLVEDLLTMHSRNTLLMSEKKVTVHAEQIHLG